MQQGRKRIMSVIAKYDQKCVRCGIFIKQGDIIQKQFNHWCKLVSCANEEHTKQPKPNNNNIPVGSSSTPPPPPPTNQVKDDEDLKLFTHERTKLLLSINSQVKKTLVVMQNIAEPNGAMIGQFTKIIYDEWSQQQQQQRGVKQ